MAGTLAPPRFYLPNAAEGTTEVIRTDGSWESVFGGYSHFRMHSAELNYTCGEPIKRLLVDRNNGSKRRCPQCQAIVAPRPVKTK